MAEYFCEVLTEEIPAWMHDAAAATIQEQLAKLAPFVTINTTPRRIAFMLGGLAVQEPDREEEVKGPPRKAAYDPEGKPTKALDGFLKKNNAAIGDVLEGGDYVRIRRVVAGRATGDVLRERVPQIIEGLRWPKMMRWGGGEHAWIRPIHSVISVLEGEHLPISIFGVASGTKTAGHRTLAPRAIDVRTWNDYVTKLELARVVVDAHRRLHVMAERALVLGNQVGGMPAEDASIWAQWQYLTEYPGVVRAEFRREYLDLP